VGEELGHVIDHPFPAVRRKFQNARVHSDRILRTGLYAISAEDAHAQIDVEPDGILFNVGLRMFSSHDVDAMSGADGLAHHACHTPRRAIRASSQTVQGAQPGRERASLFRILIGLGSTEVFGQSYGSCCVNNQISEEVTGS